MIALVERLEKAGLAYRADDGSVYFAIRRFPSYGRLSRLDTRTLQTGARVAQDDYAKEDASDFALWKAAKPEDEATGAAWDSPWGRGRPGWHLECSAMAMELLGETLDLHCGGVDLIFPHHEDEIAQSEGATGKVFSRHWCHGEFLLTDGAKMAKRVGNVITVDDLRAEQISAAAVRHLVFNTHYRQVLNLSDAALAASGAAVAHLGELAERLDAPTTIGGTAALGVARLEMEEAVRTALFDDLNSPRALAAVFEFARAANADLDRRGPDRSALDQARQGLRFINSVLGIVPAPRLGGLVDARGPVSVTRPAADAAEAELIAGVERRLLERAKARGERDFARGDAIRDELLALGIAIADSGAGTSWKRVK